MTRKVIIPAIIAAILASVAGSAYLYDDNPDGDIEFQEDEIDVLEVHFIDVDQGDSTLLITPSGQTILVDGGDKGKGQKIINYLNSININEIDLLITTHPDSDHIGGVDEMIAGGITVHKIEDNGHTREGIIQYNEYKQIITNAERNNNYEVIQEDKIIYDPDVDIVVIVPYDDDSGLRSELNANSILLKVTYGGKSVLLTGDCEDSCERRILQDDFNPDIGGNIDSDILKVGHHGSDTSTSDEFLMEVSPDYGVISVGEGNRYDLPDDVIINRLNDYGMDIYRTDENGNIVLTIDASGNIFVGLEKE